MKEACLTHALRAYVSCVLSDRYAFEKAKGEMNANTHF
jgi:hypothetical protein